MKSKRQSRRRGQRGFTLIELMVSMVAGMIVAAGAFSFARASTRAFQQETRIANAMSSTMFGFRRLVSDIERASFLSTPNIQREFLRGNSVCLKPDNTFPLGIQRLAGVQIERGGTYATSGQQSPQDAANGLSPDRIILGGSLLSTEQFPIRGVEVAGGQTILHLIPTSGPVTRLFQGELDATKRMIMLQGNLPLQPGLFAPGRIVRIVDKEGFQHFGVVASVNLSADGAPTISLSNVPGIYTRENGTATPTNPVCKGLDLGTGAYVNVVNRVQYEVRDLRDLATYNELYAAAATSTGVAVPLPADDAKRFELVRSELDAQNNVIAGSEELIAEFAVDLKFGMTVATPTNPGTAPSPALSEFDVGDPNVYGTYTQPVTTTPAAVGPERIKAIRVRLGVRSREADRAQNVPATFLTPLPSGQSRGIYRYKTLSGNYARVRMLQADVTLANQAGVFW
jgi:prepilin-type N-terminal cleavage/methylation domain-containing protein